MNDRVYNKGVERLRNPERIARLEVDRVVGICLNENKISSIIDIGTGSGIFAEAFYNAGLRVCGIDINKDMIDEAKRITQGIEFKIAAAEKIPYENNSFDASFFSAVFHEVDDYKIALSEAFRVSKMNTFILEWGYEVEENGPPFEHRLKPDFIIDLALSSGYKEVKMCKLNTLVLYILNK